MNRYFTLVPFKAYFDPYKLQGEQEDKKTHDLGGHAERDVIAITKTGWPMRFKWLFNKFQ